MKKYLRKISSFFLFPLYHWYRKGERKWKHGDIRVKVFPGVFHPGLFFSTRFMKDYLSMMELNGKTILELGAGSGFLSVYCARSGGIVTATDINPDAVKNVIANAAINQVTLSVVQSDLFSDLPLQVFDIMVINPPYFMKRPADMAGYAWYCCEDAEYFRGLFAGLRPYVHENSEVLMVLSDECRTDIISDIAFSNGFSLNLQKIKKFITEQNFIYSIRSINYLD